jgi:hypothetical protein
MATATIKLVNAELLSTFYFTKNPAALAQKLLEEGRYKVAGTMGVPGREGMAAAEEIFDLTNNPSRDDEREELYGRFRSVSVGDIVNVDGADWLCCSLGWWKL